MIDNRFEQYWRSTIYRPRLRYALLGSILAHVLLVVILFGYFNWRPKTKPPEVFTVTIEQMSEAVSDVAPREVVENSPPVPTPEPPKPEPPKPEPVPEPKVEPPKPEPEKPVEKPMEKPVEKPTPPVEKPESPTELAVREKEALKKKEAEVKKKQEAAEAEKKKLVEEKRLEEEKTKMAAEKKKEEEKKKLEEEKKKEDEKKKMAEEKKKEDEKKKLEEEKKKMAAEEEKKKLEALAKNKGPVTQGVEDAQLPNALRGWAANVKRKVDRTWVLPAGISLGAEGETIKVGFYVTSDGDLMSEPNILEGTTQKALDASCISAIKAVVPFPPFPEDFNEPEQYVVYVFRAIP